MLSSTATSRRSSLSSGPNGSGFRRRHSHHNRTSGEVGIDRESQDEDGIVKVPIIGYEVMEERARFTVFKLRVENEKINESWLVFRRYTDFERLCAKLKEEHPTLSINLPPKRWLRDNFESAFLDDRMKGLQAFVDSILIQHKLAHTLTVREFFCLDEPPMYPENAEESRAIFGTLEETLIQLKEELHQRDTENELLRAELALVKTQHDNLARLTRNCRHCSHRVSLTLSPLHKHGRDSPIASSTPNAQDYFSSKSRGSSLHSSFQSLSTPKGRNSNHSTRAPSLASSQKSKSFPQHTEAGDGIKLYTSPSAKLSPSAVVRASENTAMSTPESSSPSSE